MKKAIVIMMAAALVLVIAAIGVPKLTGQEDEKAALPADAEKDAIIGTWETDSSSTDEIKLTFNEDGSIEGTVNGSDFDASWGYDEEYIIYNNKDEDTFHATIKDEEMLLSSSSAVSTASKWTLVRISP